VRSNSGFTLLEMIVATTIMGIAVVGLLIGISGATRNAARLRDYDRVVQLARLRMNELLLDERLPRNTEIAGLFDPALAGGLNTGWRARVTLAEASPAPAPGDFALDRIQLEIWWMAGQQRRTFALDSYRRRTLRAEDIAPAVSP
jgi:prepilin-type N-terminal cleavage/methylation domain-containing protein